MAQKEFAVIYRWSVDPAHEAHFRERWKRGTERLKHLGSLGTCPSREANGDFIAFARWPSEAASDKAFAAIAPFEPWPGILSFEETRLCVEEDLLSRAAGSSRTPKYRLCLLWVENGHYARAGHFRRPRSSSTEPVTG